MEGGEYNYQTSVELPGYVAEVVVASYLEIIPGHAYNEFWKGGDYINNASASCKVYKDLGRFCRIERVEGQEKDRLNFFQMPPGFTCVIKTRSAQSVKDSIRFLNQLTKHKTSDLSRQLFSEVPLSGLNHLLFRCEQEERDLSNGTRGTYGLTQYGAFKYAGIASVMHVLRHLKVNGDMGHELCNNMREGNWYVDYTVQRLSECEPLRAVTAYLNEYLAHVKRLQPTYKPLHGCRVIEKLYNCAVYEVVARRMTD